LFECKIWHSELYTYIVWSNETRNICSDGTWQPDQNEGRLLLLDDTLDSIKKGTYISSNFKKLFIYIPRWSMLQSNSDKNINTICLRAKAFIDFVTQLNCKGVEHLFLSIVWNFCFKLWYCGWNCFGLDFCFFELTWSLIQIDWIFDYLTLVIIFLFWIPF
jgi:hypothetical protein